MNFQNFGNCPRSSTRNRNTSIIASFLLTKQEGAELCRAQPAKHKLFGSTGAISFGFELLMVEL